MTEQDKRIVIAEACGWSWKKTDFVEFGAEEPLLAWFNPDGFHKHGQVPPDYLNDLNAMNEAEKILEPRTVCELGGNDMLHEYRSRLELICIGNFGGVIRATAAQRAEALIDTLLTNGRIASPPMKK